MKARQSNKLPLCIYSTVESSSRASSPVIPSEPRLSNKQLEEKNWLHMATQLQNLRFYGFSYCFSFVLFFIFVLVKSTAFFPAAAARKVTQNPKLIQFVFFLSTIRLFCVFPLFFFCFVACCAHNIRILCNNEFSIELN